MAQILRRQVLRDDIDHRIKRPKFCLHRRMGRCKEFGLLVGVVGAFGHRGLEKCRRAAREDAGGAREAGELRVGVVRDLLPLCLAAVLKAAQAAITMTTGTSADVPLALGEGRLDLAGLARQHQEPDAVLTLPMLSLAAPCVEVADSVPHVAAAPPCPFHDAARAVPELAGVAADLRFVSPSLEAVRLAARHCAGSFAERRWLPGRISTVAGRGAGCRRVHA